MIPNRLKTNIKPNGLLSMCKYQEAVIMPAILIIIKNIKRHK